VTDHNSDNFLKVLQDQIRSYAVPGNGACLARLTEIRNTLLNHLHAEDVPGKSFDQNVATATAYVNGAVAALQHELYDHPFWREHVWHFGALIEGSLATLVASRTFAVTSLIDRMDAEVNVKRALGVLEGSGIALDRIAKASEILRGNL
jgi:hypothetical protein